MYEASKAAPQEAMRDLDKAFAHFFRWVKAGEKPGHPRFENRRKGVGGFGLNQPCIAEHGRIRLPRIGWVRRMPGERGRIPPGTYSACRVTEHAGRWFVSVLPKTEHPRERTHRESGPQPRHSRRRLYECRRQLEDEGQRYGCRIETVNPAYTSQTCSACGARNNIGTSTHDHCNACGLDIDRDLIAAINILAAASCTDAEKRLWSGCQTGRRLRRSAVRD